MSDLDRIKLRDVAWNFIANNDESAKYITDGEIDMGAEFLADFFEHAEAKRMEFETRTEPALPIQNVSVSVRFKKHSHFKEPLTIGREYEVYAHYGNFVAVVDDNDELTTHHEALFDFSAER